MARIAHLAPYLFRMQEALDGYNSGGYGGHPKLVEALTALLQAVEGPKAHLSRIRLSPLLNMCMLMAIETGVLEAIVEADDEGLPITASELAESTKQQETMIVRFMRLLTVNGICDEIAPKEYRANTLAVFLVEPDQAGATRNMVDLMFPIGGQLVPQLRRERGISESAESEGDTTPFRATYGMSMLEYFRQNPEQKAAFDNYVAGQRVGFRNHWFDHYPAMERLQAGSNSEPVDTFAVDIGGCKGHDLVAFKEHCDKAHGRFVLQDLAPSLEGLDLSQQGIEVMPHDFFEPQPIQGARVYYFRSIFHDWSDDKCRQILSHTAKAMTRGYSKVIIEEMVLPESNASWRAASLDVLQLMMFEGKERSLEQWKTLLESAGLEISGIWHVEHGSESIVEAVLKGDATDTAPNESTA